MIVDTSQHSDANMSDSFFSKTLACPLKSKKQFAQLEAGLRSRDWGMPEGTAYRDISCTTMRKNTERSLAVTEGTNRCAEIPDLLGFVDEILAEISPSGQKPDHWDGQIAGRILDDLKWRLA